MAKYTHITNPNKMENYGKEIGVDIDEHLWNGGFKNNAITMNGKILNFDSDENFTGDEEEVKGLYCPDCDSQAFKTDHPSVAVCGDCPGWYFFYRKREQKKEAKKKLILRNGEMVEVSNVTKGQGIT